MNISSLNDYSFLFSGMSSGNNASTSTMNFFSDYASIKNGSYAKLMKAYYGTGKETSEAPKATSSKESKVPEEVKKLNKVQTATDDLKDAADALGAKDAKMDYESVKKFVDSYNASIKAVNAVTDKSTVNRATRMVEQTISNAKLLGKIGVTLNEDSTLSIDKETFESAGSSTVNALFQGAGSYGYNISAQASLVNYSADHAITRAGTYTSTAAYDTTLSTGNLYNSYM